MADGDKPQAGLIADAKGDLFGTTEFGGANGDGTVFEIVKTPTGYASTPTEQDWVRQPNPPYGFGGRRVTP
ncbi:MAG TPA: choice-of-anchor tandem repeat GloVer-containing protein [Roseiarcus sp.]|nr:choice-of-anchor tandem repeat GloVer-containing protein [Roseiarcus sp.]